MIVQMVRNAKVDNLVTMAGQNDRDEPETKRKKKSKKRLVFDRVLV
jgi:hypothetical protein